jgi:thymidylate synthase
MMINAVLIIDESIISLQSTLEEYLGGSIEWVELSQFYSTQFSILHLFVSNDLSIMPVRENLRQWSLIKHAIAFGFQHYTFEKISNPFDQAYLTLLNELRYAPLRQTRNSMTRSLFCRHLSFDLEKGFPLLTTKKMFWKGILEEFLFFIHGETDTRILEQKGVRIWSGNTSRSFLDNLGMYRRPEKQMGPMYGYQWRFFNAEYDETTGKPLGKGIDQLVEVIQTIRNDPHSRRHLLTDYNPSQAKQGVLYPCHSLMVQFYIDQDRLSMFCYNRSSDVFLGLPFNIASSSLLLSLVAKLTGKTPHMLHLSLGDCHIYQEHEEAVEKQLNPWRLPWKPAQLTVQVDSEMDLKQTLDHLSAEHFVLQDYKSHGSIQAPMIS